MDASDLSTVFRGVRAPAGHPRDHDGVLRAFLLRRPEGHVISHTTALKLWGAPLPRRIEDDSRLHVSSFDGVTPRARHTIGHTLNRHRTRVETLDGIPLTSAATSWVLSAPLLNLEWLIAAGDFLVTGSAPFDGSLPHTTIDRLADALAAHTGSRGARRAREALGLIRYGSLSAQETRLRLMLAAARLPEPALNFRVMDEAESLLAMVDLAFPDDRVAIEYESLLHQDEKKFRRDIRKVDDLTAAGWRVHRLTADDVDPRLLTPASRAVVQRIARDLIHPGNPRETALVHRKAAV